MANSSKQKDPKQLQRFMLIGAGLLFFSAVAIPIFQSIVEGINQPTTSDPTPATVQDLTRQLEQQEEGFVAVLEREPENTTALQGLVRIRLQLEDYEGAVQPIKKLLELYPEEQDQQALKALLTQVEQTIARTNPEATTNGGSDATVPEAESTQTEAE